MNSEKIADILVPPSLYSFYSKQDQMTPKENFSEDYNNNDLDSNHPIISSPNENENDKKSEIELKLKKPGTYNIEQEITLLNNMMPVENTNDIFIKAIFENNIKLLFNIS